MSRELTFWLLKVIPTIQYVILLILTVSAIIVFLKRKASKRYHLVSLSSIVACYGLIFGLIYNSFIMFINGHFLDINVPKWAVFEVFYIGCVALMLAYLNETIKYDDEVLISSNFLGIKHKHYFRDITSISRFEPGALSGAGPNYIIYFGSKKVKVDGFALDGNAFITHVKDLYVIQHSNTLPLHRPKVDPSNGKLLHPWVTFSMFILITVMTSFIILFMANELEPADNSIPSDSEERIVSFYTYDFDSRDSGTWLFYTTVDEKALSLAWVDGYEITLPIPHTLCKGGFYKVIVRKWKRTYVNSDYEIIAILTVDGKPIISPLDRNTARRNTQKVGCTVILILSIIGLLYGILGLFVCRYPEYCPRLSKTIYKDLEWFPEPNEFYRNIKK